MNSLNKIFMKYSLLPDLEKGLYTQRPGCIDVFFYVKIFGRLFKLQGKYCNVSTFVFSASGVCNFTQYNTLLNFYLSEITKIQKYTRIC